MANEKEFVLYECIAGKRTPPGPPDDWEPAVPRELAKVVWEQTQSVPLYRFFIAASDGGRKSALVKAMEVCFKRFDAKTSEDLPKPFALTAVAATSNPAVDFVFAG